MAGKSDEDYCQGESPECKLLHTVILPSMVSEIRARKIQLFRLGERDCTETMVRCLAGAWSLFERGEPEVRFFDSLNEVHGLAVAEGQASPAPSGAVQIFCGAPLVSRSRDGQHVRIVRLAELEEHAETIASPVGSQDCESLRLLYELVLSQSNE